MIMASPEGMVLRYNDGSERTFGFSRQEVVDQHLSKLLRADSESGSYKSGYDRHVQAQALIKEALNAEVEVEVRGSFTCMTSRLTVPV
jgi:PAS domain-containing protein